MKCQNCHRNVTRKSKFCSHCGNAIVPRTSGKSEQQSLKMSISNAMMFVGLGIVISLLIVVLNKDSKEPPLQQGLNFSNAMTIQSPAVLDIAREFMCFCGTCTDRLFECDCEHPKGALEVKSFILQQIRGGHKKPHIVEMVANRFGSSKAKPDSTI